MRHERPVLAGLVLSLIVIVLLNPFQFVGLTVTFDPARLRAAGPRAPARATTR